MKKILLILVILSNIILLSTSCKKGEDDPAISLRSRDSRFAGKWHVTLIDYVNTSFSTGDTFSTTTTMSLNGSNLTLEIKSGIVTTTYKAENYDLNVEIKKNNDYSCSQSYTENGQSKTSSYLQKWNWLNTEKTLVNLPMWFGGSTSFFNNNIWHLRELRDKKLVLVMERSYDDNNTVSEDKFTATFRIEFEKVK